MKDYVVKTSERRATASGSQFLNSSRERERERESSRLKYSSRSVKSTTQNKRFLLGNERQIKSSSRVRDRGEVFTGKREVNNILALTEATSNPYWRFLEPACGNGNFLEAILRQRLERLKQDRIEWNAKNREFSILKVLSTVYGVDIAEDNIEECKKRLQGVVFEYFKNKSSKGFLLVMDEIMRTNLIVGDMLNGKDKIFFVEYTTPMKNFFIRKVFALTDMEAGIEKALKTFPMVRYDGLTPIDFSFLNKDAEAPPGVSEVGKQTNLFGELI